MNATTRTGVAIAAATTLIGAALPTAAPAIAEPVSQQLHNVTYIARVDAIAGGTVVTFLLHDNQTTSGDMDVLAFTNFEAHTVLADPSKAGMQVRLRWPNSANVHCEIDVDGISAVKVDRFINTWANTSDPLSGVLQCGAPLPGFA
ncbi:MAG TPA: hypothetical protein VFR17_01710 [Mycobacterium sp.]|nr:hypothetical protein [Mycobacterium sp.]